MLNGRVRISQGFAEIALIGVIPPESSAGCVNSVLEIVRRAREWG